MITNIIFRRSDSPITSDKPHYPYELPEGWCWCNLNEIAESSLGKTLDKSKNTGKVYPYLCALNVKWNAFDLSVVKSIKLEDNEKERYQVLKGDLLICEGGDVGRSAIWNSNEPIYFQNALHRVRFFGNIVADFYLYLFWCYKNYNWIDDICNGVTIKHLTQDKINALHLPLPPVAEQQRIVIEVKKWFVLIDQIEQIENNLQSTIKQTKSKILDLAIHGKLVPQDPTDEPASELLKRINPKAEITCDNGHYQKLPEGWCMTNIGSLFDAVSAKRVLKSEWKDKGVPFYRAREIVQLNKEGFADKDLFISEEHFSEIKDKYGIPAYGDIMISAVGSIGYTYIVKENDVFYYKDASVLCLKNTRHWNSKFFSIWLASPFLQEQMYKNSKGTTVDTITLEKLKGYVIPFPPLNEQHRIVAKVEEIFAQLDTIEASL